MSDAVTVRVTGLECFGYHGVFPEEREHRQRFVVDIEMDLTELASIHTDHLADTVDYEAVGLARKIRLGLGLDELGQRAGCPVFAGYRIVRERQRVDAPADCFGECRDVAGIVA